jgi:hypothetical protein
VMQAHAVDLVLAGHAHNYQRFAAQTPAGVRSATGITEIIAGAGGKDLQSSSGKGPNQAAYVNKQFGVLQLGLTASGWTSSLRTIGGAVLDPASGSCH